MNELDLEMFDDVTSLRRRSEVSSAVISAAWH
jgi:hypothetical protein